VPPRLLASETPSKCRHGKTGARVSGERTSAPEESVPPSARNRRDIHIPMTTIIKVVGSGLLLWALFLLWPEFLLFLIAVLLAVTLNPAVRRMEDRRIGRVWGVVIIAAVAIGLLTVFVLFVLPPLAGQMTHLLQELPTFRARILSRIPARYPAVQQLIHELFQSPFSPKVVTTFDRWFGWGRSALTGLVVAGIVLVLTLYLLLHGRSLYAWLLAFIPRTHREKLATTMHEVSGVVHAYVSGQLLAAALFAVFTAILLTILGVPAVAPLAIIAGLCDVVPVLGIVLATVPAVLLALVVSPGAAAVVLVAYLAYHLFETYFLLPRIYGNKLKISSLAVLLALLIGGRLQGIIGAVLVLPLVAAYPIIERHWLRGFLAARVLTDHKALAQAAETGSDTAIDTVLHGEKHASEGLASSGGGK
jgi:predicted PurR-regulated permease PerM